MTLLLLAAALIAIPLGLDLYMPVPEDDPGPDSRDWGLETWGSGLPRGITGLDPVWGAFNMPALREVARTCALHARRELATLEFLLIEIYQWDRTAVLRERSGIIVPA